MICTPFASLFLALIFQPIHADPAAPVTLKSLQNMGKNELEALYRAGATFQPMQGFYPGTALPKPGSPLGNWRSDFIGLAWKGKNLYPEQGVMVNQVGRREMVRAELEQGVSWLDDKPSVIFDYRIGPRWAQKARDEVRQVAPGLYLGIMYVREGNCPRQAMFFVLEECQP